MNLQSLLLFGGLIFLLGFAAGFLVSWLVKEEKEPQKPSKSQALPPAQPAEGAEEPERSWGDNLTEAQGGSHMETEASRPVLRHVPEPPSQVDQPTLIDQPPAQVHSPLPPSPARPSLEGISQPLRSRPVEPVRANPLDSIARAVQSPKPQAARSLAMQIDEILQENIAGSDLARRGLCLVDLPNHELGVVLDLHTYRGIEQVPDPSATQAIRAAVKEWQARNR